MPKQVLRKLSKYFVEPNAEFQLDPSFEFTNSPDEKHEYLEPYANPENVQKFKELQLYESVGLVEPVGESSYVFCCDEKQVLQVNTSWFALLEVIEG